MSIKVKASRTVNAEGFQENLIEQIDCTKDEPALQPESAFHVTVVAQHRGESEVYDG
ncbi:MAG TPA: hypothetical protein VFD58_10870 [Blastocatellia bacterium]|nr:hypothetical protein [Blastocatellia bacterium]